MGGRLIRNLVATMKKTHLKLPIVQPVAVAVSGGADSTALAILLAKYGRRIVDRRQLSIVHLSHHWREGARDRDLANVQELANRLGLKLLHGELESPRVGVNLENDARGKRLDFFRRIATSKKGDKKQFRFIFTAHHLDDIAETNLWRILRGQWSTHSDGIRLKDSFLLRPLLNVRKNDLEAFCVEENAQTIQDPTNKDPKYFRGLVRSEVFPALAKSGFDPVNAFAGLTSKRRQ